MSLEELLRNLVYAVIVGVLPVLVNCVRVMANAGVKSATAEIENTTLQTYLIEAIDMVGNIVAEVNQTFVDELKQEGAFTEDAKIEAKKKAVDKANAMFSDAVKQAITTVYNDFNDYLDTLIESTVHKEKVSK